MTVNLGYACINMTLQKQKITCNRGMIKRTFQAKGIAYASELALSNVTALKKIIEWNNANDISVYRMTSCLFPWFSEYDIFDMPDIDAIADIMSEAGKIAMDAGQRLSLTTSRLFRKLSQNLTLTLLRWTSWAYQCHHRPKSTFILAVPMVNMIKPLLDFVTTSSVLLHQHRLD